MQHNIDNGCGACFRVLCLIGDGLSDRLRGYAYLRFSSFRQVVILAFPFSAFVQFMIYILDRYLFQMIFLKRMKRNTAVQEAQDSCSPMGGCFGERILPYNFMTTYTMQTILSSATLMILRLYVTCHAAPLRGTLDNDI